MHNIQSLGDARYVDLHRDTRAPAELTRARNESPSSSHHPPRTEGSSTTPSDDELRDVFHEFVGQTFFGQLLGAMRKTVGKPAYLHGGRAEEVFQNQLDQILSEKMTDASAETFAEPMFELFRLGRQ